MYRNPYQGTFIVFEGLDGSGQDTQAEILFRHLQKCKWTASLTCEPTMDSESGRRIRRVLEKKETIEPDKFQQLYVQDREEHLENSVIPALKQTSFVICIRYFLSTCAFGGINIDMEWLIGLNNGFILPNITLILDVDPEICLERINKRGNGIEFFETKEKLTKVRRNYRELAERFPNVYLINGEPSIEVVHKSILKTYREWERR